MQKIKVGLVQINNSFSNQNYFPYSVGILQAYAQKYLKDKELFEFSLPLYKRIPLKDALKQLDGCEIVFFSTYTWNINISLEIARQLKTVNNNILVVFGGPQIPIRGIKEFLKKYRFIDLACHGEGEKAFLAILNNFKTKQWKDVPNISYLNNKEEHILTEQGMRTTDLAEIPSPYTEGVFDHLMKANPNENWVALWETNRGCPFSCSYCVWGASTNKKVYQRDIKELYREIDWFSINKIEFIFCCDANFGIFPRDLLLAEYTAKNKDKFGYPNALSVQNTKNSTMRIYNLYKTLSDHKLNKGVSLAIQSANPDTLKSIKRENISLDTFNELQEKFSESGIETFTDVILGLPRETYSSFADGVSNIISSGQHNRIQFNNLSILTGSEMDDPAYLKKYGIVTVNNKLVNIHGSLTDDFEIAEHQRLVVATRAMPQKDWVKARMFGWMTALLHFDKLIQIPLILINSKSGVPYRNLIESFLDNEEKHPVLTEIIDFFRTQAECIQNGGTEFAQSKKWLNIWWPPDELMLIKLCAENKLSEFYKEAGQLMGKFLDRKKINNCKDILHDAIVFNQNLLKMPFQDKNLKIKLSYNIWDIYKANLTGKNVPVEKGEYYYEIDRTTSKWASWDDWCREVVWYGNKRGAYLYSCREIN